VAIEHHIVKRDGFHWHVATSGPQDAPPVLLLHCWSGNWTLWQKTMEQLEGQYRFIAPDHLGFGQSDKPLGDHYRIDQQATRSLNLLRHFGYERACVMGHSMGGQIALTLAGMYPEAVERLIVVDPAVTGKLHPFTKSATPSMALVRRGVPLPLAWSIKLASIFPALGLQLARAYLARPHEQPEAALYWLQQLITDGQLQSSAWAEKAIVEWNVTPLLGSISAPTLAIWGELDLNIPVSECDVLAKNIRDFKAVRLPRIGHFPMIEAWDTYIGEVEVFLRG
jgi:pimeloyl-ACP methyl ester carboxylesterase